MTLRGVLTCTRRHTARVLNSLTCDQYTSSLHVFSQSLGPCRESPVAVDSAARGHHQDTKLHSATSCGTPPSLPNQHGLAMMISSQTCGRPSGWHSQRTSTALRPSVNVPHHTQWRGLCSSTRTAAAPHLCPASSMAAGGLFSSTHHLPVGSRATAAAAAPAAATAAASSAASSGRLLLPQRTPLSLVAHPPLLHPPRSAPSALPSAIPTSSTPTPLLTHSGSNTCTSLLCSNSSGILIRTSSSSSSAGASRGGPAYAASQPSSSSSFSSDQGQGPAQGLPPPVIISPVALRVVVIGWMGCNRRYLNKYGALWARSGDHEVLMVRPSVTQTLVRWRGVVVAGRDIDRVARLHRECPAMPTVYHVFSTGGFVHCGTMWRWMDEVEDVAQRRDLLEEVRGIILDSAPSAVHPDMASRAIVSAMTNTPVEEVQHGMGGVKGGMLGATRSFLDWYLTTKGVKLRTEEVYDAWYNLAPVCPQLYLYSDADPLVPPGDVEKYMEIQESRGVEVSGYKWQDSGHVEHYRRHPHEYAYQISTFLARALKDW